MSPSTRGADFQSAQGLDLDQDPADRTDPFRLWRGEPSPRRPRHPDVSGVPYFITTRCSESQPIFVGELAEAAVAELMSLRRRYGFLLLSFVFMSTHAHFVIAPAQGFTISQTMKAVKGAIARRINEIRGTQGSVWQDGFRDDVPKSLEALNAYVRYIEENPVTAGLATTVAEFVYGSGDGRCRADYNAFLLDERITRTESPRRVENGSLDATGGAS